MGDPPPKVKPVGWYVHVALVVVAGYGNALVLGDSHASHGFSLAFAPLVAAPVVLIGTDVVIRHYWAADAEPPGLKVPESHWPFIKAISGTIAVMLILPFLAAAALRLAGQKTVLEGVEISGVAMLAAALRLENCARALTWRPPPPEPMVVPSVRDAGPAKGA